MSGRYCRIDFAHFLYVFVSFLFAAGPPDQCTNQSKTNESVLQYAGWCQRHSRRSSWNRHCSSSCCPSPCPCDPGYCSRTPLPVAVAPVPPAAVPLVAAAGTASALKNGYPNVATVASGTPPPHEGVVAVNPSNQPQQQQQQQPQQPHLQPHHQQQPRFLYAAPPAPGSPYGTQPQLQLYAFHHPSSFYTPTVLQVRLTTFHCILLIDFKTGIFVLLLFKAWPSTTAAGTSLFDLAPVFAMNGLSPQATFKPSPNPRYPGSMGGRGRGAHRRNLSTHSSATNHSESGASAHSPAFSQQQSGGSVSAAGASAGSSNHTASGSASNGPSAPPPSKNTSSSSLQPAVTSVSSSPSTNAGGGSGSGRDSKESSTSGTSHHPVQKQATDGPPSAGRAGYNSTPGEERRHHHEVNNERGS